MDRRDSLLISNHYYRLSLVQDVVLPTYLYPCVNLKRFECLLYATHLLLKIANLKHIASPEAGCTIFDNCGNTALT